jgi:Chlorophyll A-B binding protein
MLATVGFLVGEAVESSPFFFDAQVSGPGITHLAQVPLPFWLTLVAVIGYAERTRLEKGWVEPEKVVVVVVVVAAAAFVASHSCSFS